MVARQAHNLEVACSSPASATINTGKFDSVDFLGVFLLSVCVLRALLGSTLSLLSGRVGISAAQMAVRSRLVLKCRVAVSLCLFSKRYLLPSQTLPFARQNHTFRLAKGHLSFSALHVLSARRALWRARWGSAERVDRAFWGGEDRKRTLRAGRV